MMTSVQSAYELHKPLGNLVQKVLLCCFAKKGSCPYLSSLLTVSKIFGSCDLLTGRIRALLQQKRAQVLSPLQYLGCFEHDLHLVLQRARLGLVRKRESISDPTPHQSALKGQK